MNLFDSATFTQLSHHFFFPYNQNGPSNAYFISSGILQYSEPASLVYVIFADLLLRNVCYEFECSAKILWCNNKKAKRGVQGTS